MSKNVKQNKFSELSNEQLLMLWNDDEAKNALYLRILPILRKAIQPFKHCESLWLDDEDLIQEASLAFVKAAVSYDVNKSSSFATYLWLCVRSHMLNLTKRAKRNTNQNGSNLSLYDIVQHDDTADVRIIDTLAAPTTPEDEALNEQSAQSITETAMHTLSQFEYSVFKLRYINGKSITETAAILGCSKKSAENTLYRVRCKLKSEKI